MEKAILTKTTAQSMPAFALKTELFKYGSSPRMGSDGVMVTGDGALWTHLAGQLFLFSVATGRWGKPIDLPKNRPSTVKGKWLAPFDAQTVYFVGTEGNTQWIFIYKKNQETAKLPALPEGMPCGVWIANDGTLWAVNDKDKLYSYSGTMWQPIPALPQNAKLHTLSVGNANFTLAIGVVGGYAPGLFVYKDGAWSNFLTQVPPGISWISACSDGSYWMLAGTKLTHTSSAKTTSFNIPQDYFHPQLPIYFTATRFACFFDVFIAGGVFCAACGIVDESNSTWPTMNDKQQAAYTSLSEELEIIDVQGIRVQYANKNATLQNYINKIGTLTCPTGIDPNAWKWVCDLIKEELTNANAVRTFFGNLENLNTQVYLATLSIYNEVLQMVGLPPKPEEQPPTIVDIALMKLAPKIKDFITDKFPEIGQVMMVATQVNNIAALFVSEEHGAKDTSKEIAVACSKLASVLLEVNTKALEVNATNRDLILKDSRRLTAVGQALTSGLWYWPSSFDVTTVKTMGDPIRLDMYQTLLPVRWQIALIETIVMTKSPDLPNAPSYCYMYKTNGAVFWWNVWMAIGGSTMQETTGPFPAKELVQAVMKLTSPQDLLTNANGWKLPVATMPGYLPPPGDLKWQPYRP